MTPRLVLLNGPPGVGKSTLARRYVDEHPLVLALDVDVVRAMLGVWREHLTEAGLAARAMALEMARAHLGAGHDVVVPQYLGRVEFIDQLAALARACDAEFVEIVLMATKQDAARRYRQRGGEEPPPLLEEMYERLTGLLGRRPDARLIDTASGRIDDAYDQLIRALRPAGA